MDFRIGPRDIGGVFDDALALWKGNLKVIVASYGVAVFPAALLQTFSAAQSGTVDFVAWDSILAMQLEELAYLAAVSSIDLLTGAFVITYVGRRAVGRPWTLKACAGYALRKAVILLPLFLVIFVAMTLGMCMLLIPGLALSVFVYLVTPVIMLEDEGFAGGVRRSFTLVARQFWQALAVILLVGLVSLAAEGIAAPGVYYGAWWLLAPAVAVSAITSSFATMVKLAFYLSARARVEHLDVDIAVRDAAPVEPRAGSAL